MIVKTIAPTAPITMNGLRTRNLSEMNPISSNATALNAQFQLPSPLASFWLKPKIVWK